LFNHFFYFKSFIFFSGLLVNIWLDLQQQVDSHKLWGWYDQSQSPNWYIQVRAADFND